MPFNPSLALTNSQLRDQGMQSALENFMGYFKAVRAQKDEADKTGLQDEILRASRSAQDSTTGAPRLGMDELGMPTGLKGAGMEPGQAAQTHLADVKAKYLMKYGQAPVTGQDMLAADLEREDKLAQIGDSKQAREARKGFQRAVGKDSTLSEADLAFYNMKPDAYGDRLKPTGLTYLPTTSGFLPMPNKTTPGATAPAAGPVQLPGGEIPKPIRNDPAPVKWVSKVDSQGRTYQENPVTGETRDTNREAPQKVGQMVVTPEALAEKAKAGIALIDQMIGAGDSGKAHPGFSGAVGAKGLAQGFGMLKEPVAGSKEADFKALLNQVSGQAFLDARQSLKGGGPITDMEGTKAQQAITRMATSQSEGDFRTAAKEYRKFLENIAANPAGTAATSSGPKAGDTKTNAAGTLRFNGTIWERISE